MVIPPGTQPKIITSPDGKSQIINQRRAYIDGFGSYCLEGVIKNISSEAEIVAKIQVDYYDINGTKIDTELDIINILKPGGTRTYYIPHAGLRRTEVKSHVISLL
jgi:hypothetical protein